MPATAQSAYERAVEQLLALGHELHATPAHKFDLANMRALLRALGHPERRFPSVLIAGTNGKGSTAATLFYILKAAGFRAGLYTSPHLVRVNERVRTAAGEISDAGFAEAHGRVEQAAAALERAGEIRWRPSFFEMLTAMAFEHFAEAKVEIAVLEVGMGGRLDATNVVEPLVSVVTDVALDHQAFLGNTIAEIAREKAGIIRARGVVVTLSQHPQANEVIGQTICECGARMVDAAGYVPPQTNPASRSSRLSSPAADALAEPGAPPATSYPLEVLGERITVASPLMGRHQRRNVALAIAAAAELGQLGFKVSAKQIEQGIRDTCWPGRLQRLAATANRPEMVLDVAHNPAGAWALRAALSDYFAGRPLVFLFGAMRDKAIGEMAEILFPLAAAVVATQAATPRAATPEEIRAAAARSGAELVCEASVSAGLARACGLARALPKALVVVTGSIYVVGEALREVEAPCG